MPRAVSPMGESPPLPVTRMTHRWPVRSPSVSIHPDESVGKECFERVVQFDDSQEAISCDITSLTGSIEHRLPPIAVSSETDPPMFGINTVRITVLLLAPVLSGPCLSPDFWYDVNRWRCRPCTPCGRDHVQLAACSTYADYFCIPLSELVAVGRGMSGSTRGVSWHETEFADEDSDLVSSGVVHEEPGTSEMSAAAVTATVLGVLFAVVATLALVSLLFKHGRCRRSGSSAKHDPRKVAGRARLFSRDRLDTAEYVHNLSRLDMRLAMDEILEKRKQAILDTQLPLWDRSNSYGDDVFIDVKGHETHPNEEGQLLAQGHAK